MGSRRPVSALEKASGLQSVNALNALNAAVERRKRDGALEADAQS